MVGLRLKARNHFGLGAQSSGIQTRPLSWPWGTCWARGKELLAAPCVRQERSGLNADAASPHLAGILSASLRPEQLTLNRTIYNRI